jgi:hypothetical protein
LTAVAFALAVAGAVYALVVPVYMGYRESDGRRTIEHRTLLQVNGPYILIPLFFPLLLILLPLLFPKQWLRIVVAVLIDLFVFIAGMSIGFFYAPAAFLMLLAACVDDSARLRDAFP